MENCSYARCMGREQTNQLDGRDSLLYRLYMNIMQKKRMEQYKFPYSNAIGFNILTGYESSTNPVDERRNS